MRRYLPLFSILLFLGALVAPTTAQIPRQISYQGVLSDNAGNLLPDGNHAIKVSIYEQVSGAQPAVFSENHAAVAVVKGIFNVIIGSTLPTGIPAALSFDKAYFLGVTVDAGEELAPRTAFTTAPYAFRAATADLASGLAPGVTGVVTSVNGQSGAVTLQGGGGTTVSQSAGVVTISSSGGTGGTGIQGVQNIDGSINVTAPNGPVATIGVADNAITSGKIADGTIVAADLSSGIVPASLPPSGPAGGDLTGTYPNPSIRDNSVVTARIADNAVTLAKLATTGATSGQVITFNGTGLVYSNPTLTLPFNAVLTSSADLLSITNNGTGRVGYFRGNSATSTAHALTGEHNSPGGWVGPAGVYGKQTGSSGIGVYGEATGSAASGISPRGVYGVSASGAGVYGYSTAGNGVTAAGDGSGNALFAWATGTGRSAYILNTASANSADLLEATTNGTSRAGLFSITNTASSANVLEATTNGSGSGLHGVHSATTGTSPGVLGESNSTVGAPLTGIPAVLGASGVLGRMTSASSGSFSAGVRGLNNSTGGFGVGVVGYQAGSGWGVYGETPSGTGVRAQSGNAGNALVAVLIAPLAATSTTVANNIAIFQSGVGFPANVARIDRTGIGFFNGGTVVGGADVAEMFEVEGARDSYEPGDVLVISTRTDRTIEKSSTPFSTLVAGVYATKPGVTLGERHIDEANDDLVPMGVVGVIPTKVTTENGGILRGDLLVTSSIRGHAMKAGANPPVGSVLGKALENFDAPGTGTIKVLVSVK